MRSTAVVTVSKYLLTGEVPAEGTTCFPDRQPFDPLPGAAAIPPEQAARAAAVLPVLSAGSLSGDQ